MKIWIAVCFFILTGCANAKSIAQSDRSENDFCSILQLVVNIPELQKYYHIKERPDRKPLKLVLNDHNIKCTSLIKFAEPVIMVNKANIKKLTSPYIEVSKINISNNRADIYFIYSVEGIKGSSKLTKKNNGEWRIDESSIFEI